MALAADYGTDELAPFVRVMAEGKLPALSSLEFRDWNPTVQDFGNVMSAMRSSPMKLRRLILRQVKRRGLFVQHFAKPMAGL